VTNRPAPVTRRPRGRVLKLIVRANARREKAPVLLQLREEVEELKVLLRLCHDAKAFSNFTSFEHATGLVSIRGFS
jgi:hypothetical protein